MLVVETVVLLSMRIRFVAPALLLAADIALGDGAEMWTGLMLAEEHRCSEYYRGGCAYDQDVELLVAQNLRGLVGSLRRHRVH